MISRAEARLKEKGAKKNLREGKVDHTILTCPVCLRGCYCCNVGRDHYGYCEDCGVSWHVGSNLVSSWKNETEKAWQKNKEILSKYRLIMD